jgi:hypothetical protein
VHKEVHKEEVEGVIEVVKKEVIEVVKKEV